MKSSIGSRSLKLLGLATKVGRKELAQNLKDQFVKGVDEVASGRLKTRLEQARLIAENLSQLKGAAMKAGQLLSLDASDFFPPEAVEILAKLQSQADPVAWETLRQVFVEDLGEERLREFTSYATLASASASIGQVHRGHLHGRDVAIKIQYPGVADSIDSDLAILKRLAQGFVSVTGRKMDLSELFDELAMVLKQEADYRSERENMLEFRRLLAGNPDFAVPEPIDPHCSRRVLTMSWEEGQSISAWLGTRPSAGDRERIGRLVLDLYCREFFEWGLVQTDPNYANFLVQTTADNRPRLVILDFGATRRYTSEFRQDYTGLLNELGTLDRARIVRSFTSFGLIDARESDETRELFAEFLLLAVEPFARSRQPFRFRDDDYARRSRQAGQKFTQSLKFSPPPRKILFLHRKLGGIFTLLKKLDVQIDLVPYWERMVGRQVE